jgi:hypothetical protein
MEMSLLAEEGRHRLRGKPAALRAEMLKFCAEDRCEDLGPTLHRDSHCFLLCKPAMSH